MPELPEVERFRQLCLPLVSPSCCLRVNCPSITPPKRFPSQAEIHALESYRVANVLRKGKLLCIVLSPPQETKNQTRDKSHDDAQGMYMYLHMGMTGRISTESCVTKLESLSKDDPYPPPHAHLILRSNGHEVCFSDPRRFGAVILARDMAEFDDLATDGMDDSLSLSGLTGQRKGIKALLLDQRVAVSGVGNWVADEVLYQSKIHPDQKFLSTDEVSVLHKSLKNILSTAVTCLSKDEEFPRDWLFHHRWSKSKKKTVKDASGRNIAFITSGGRTSALVPSIQKLRSRRCDEAHTKSSESEGLHGGEPHDHAVDDADAREGRRRTRDSPAIRSSGEDGNVQAEPSGRAFRRKRSASEKRTGGLLEATGEKPKRRTSTRRKNS